MNETLTTQELAERERVSRATVHYWIRKGWAPTSYRIGKRRLFDLHDVIVWESERKAATRR